jgi:very-short-patch-repair endonuclease
LEHPPRPRKAGERVGERGLSAHADSVGAMPRLSPLAFRRVLRKKSTDAEQVLWSRLRRHRMGRKFRRQHTVGPYTLDFYCPAARLAVELDGGQHYEGPQRERDVVRDAWLEQQGIRVLRYSDCDMLLEPDGVEEAIWQALEEIDKARSA